MKYNKKGTKVQGSLLLIHHLEDGSKYRVKSNVHFGLALGSPTEPYGTASFAGDSTYLEPGWQEPKGNYEYLVYVEDNNEPCTGVDIFRIEVRDKDGNVILVMSLAHDAADNAVEFQGENIVVPHGSKGAGRPR